METTFWSKCKKVGSVFCNFFKVDRRIILGVKDITSEVDLQNLRNQQKEVTPELYIMLAEKDCIESRKKRVEKYARYCNVRFYSNGCIYFKKNNAWFPIGTMPISGKPPELLEYNPLRGTPPIARKKS